MKKIHSSREFLNFDCPGLTIPQFGGIKIQSSLVGSRIFGLAKVWDGQFINASGTCQDARGHDFDVCFRTALDNPKFTRKTSLHVRKTTITGESGILRLRGPQVRFTSVGSQVQMQS